MTPFLLFETIIYLGSNKQFRDAHLVHEAMNKVRNVGVQWHLDGLQTEDD
jgi:hypothetical protein